LKNGERQKKPCKHNVFASSIASGGHVSFLHSFFHVAFTELPKLLLLLLLLLSSKIYVGEQQLR
jgi:hypothetical protein